jgi:uncharacterized protein (DUF427 family)
MTLTLANGPLSRGPQPTNYRIDGPENLLLFESFPRRVRALFSEQTVADTRAGKLLHETGYRPQLYIPRGDVRDELLVASDHATHCPFKGDASYWSVRVGERWAENAVWSYQEPVETASWLRDYVALYWDKMDAWLDEDERVEGCLPDPYHRIDVRESSGHVRVFVGREQVAESTRPLVLSETGEPNRYYVPREDVQSAALEPSRTVRVSAYTGSASLWSANVDGRRLKDVAWTHEAPAGEALRLANCFCFSGEGVEVWVDGERVE